MGGQTHTAVECKRGNDAPCIALFGDKDPSCCMYMKVKEQPLAPTQGMIDKTTEFKANGWPVEDGEDGKFCVNKYSDELKLQGKDMMVT